MMQLTEHMHNFFSRSPADARYECLAVVWSQKPVQVQAPLDSHQNQPPAHFHRTSVGTANCVHNSTARWRSRVAAHCPRAALTCEANKHSAWTGHLPSSRPPAHNNRLDSNRLAEFPPPPQYQQRRRSSKQQSCRSCPLACFQASTARAGGWAARLVTRRVPATPLRLQQGMTFSRCWTRKRSWVEQEQLQLLLRRPASMHGMPLTALNWQR